MKITIGEKEVEVKTISINAKCSDLCFSELKNEKGAVVAEHDGYVPALMPEEHYGDYVQLDIDLETGRILNWRKPDEILALIEDTKWKSDEDIDE